MILTLYLDKGTARLLGIWPPTLTTTPAEGYKSISIIIGKVIKRRVIINFKKDNKNL